MKTLKRLLSIALVITLMLSIAAIHAHAHPSVGDTPRSISTQNMTELTAMIAVNTYFAERIAFLTGESGSINSAVEPIINDEALHKQSLNTSNIRYISSTVDFKNIIYWDNMADVTVDENIIYTENFAQKSCTIEHRVVLYISASGDVIIGSDGYLDSIINFESASYLPAATNMSDPMTLMGSNLCILHIASAEVGTGEEPEGDNINQYTKWFGKDWEWCAIFVSWCAYQAKISSDVIKKSASPIEIKNELYKQGRHYLSLAYGGSYTPVPGDIIFMRDTPNAPGHIGIVVSVNGNSVRIIDGNWGEKVCDRNIKLTDTIIVGFGNPNYASSNHAGNTWFSSDTQHYKVCNHCSCAFSHAAHIYRQAHPASPYVCIICGHTKNYINIEI